MFHLNDLKHLLEKKVYKAQVFYLVLVFLLSFLVYQCTLPALALRPYPDFWHFGADSYRVSMEEELSHSMAAYQTAKHPLYVACATQLYRVGRKVLSRSFSSTLGENLALTFPVAVFGALNAMVAFSAFGAIGFRRLGRVFVTVMYAGSASIWIFSSFPDSYICTTFLTNLFLLAYLKDQDMKRWWLLGVLNALASYSAPQQVLLQLIPWGHFLISGMSKSHFARCLRYSITLTILFLIPYFIFLKWSVSFTFAVNEAQRWSSIYNFLDYQWWISVPTGLFALSQLGVLSPTVFESLKLASFHREITIWALLIVIVCYLVWGWRERRNEWKTVMSSLLLFCLVYAAFFIWWSPAEAFLFSAPVMLPFWLSAHSGWVSRQYKRVWLLGLVLACLLVVVYSVRLLSESRDYDVKYERVSFFRH